MYIYVYIHTYIYTKICIDMLERVVQRDSLILFWPMHTNEHTLRYILIFEYIENCTDCSKKKKNSKLLFHIYM